MAPETPSSGPSAAAQKNKGETQKIFTKKKIINKYTSRGAYRTSRAATPQSARQSPATASARISGEKRGKTNKQKKLGGNFEQF
jgi:hypothetical protein